MASVIIPAFNEEERVGELVRGLRGSALIGEIIVIDDGSGDETARAAGEAGAEVLRLPQNGGKAAALAAGVARAKSDTLLFLDADLSGFTPQHAAQVLAPVLSGEFAMFVGILDRKQWWLNRIIRFLPLISGIRAMKKEVWYAVPQKYRERFQIEVALNYFCRRHVGRLGFRLLTGIGHAVKEKKYGLFKGLWRRILMGLDLTFISLRLYVLPRKKTSR